MALSEGQKLGKYEIVEEIGRGGMATVYKAYDPATERSVAIKVMLPDMAKDPTFARRFDREAKTVAGLQHIHILPVFDYGHHDDTAYLVMPFLSGKTLVEVIEGEPLSLKEASRLFRQLAGALDYAHVRGLLHRDIKPSNVLIDDSGNALLSDFGLTRMIADSQHYTRLTATSTVVGTPAYMSPEQGQGLELTSRSDLYSLGVVLYEMLTGDVPFHAETPVAVIFKHISDPLPSVLDARPELPYEVDDVLRKALAKSPDDRYQMALDIADAFDAAIAGLPLPAPADAPHRRKVKDDGELYTEDLDFIEKPKHSLQTDVLPPIPRRLPLNKRVLAGLVTVLVIGVAAAIFLFADTEAGLELMDLPDDSLIISAGGSPFLQFTAHAGESVTSLALSPDGSRILTGGTDNVARVWNASTGEQIHALEAHSGDVLSVAYRPDDGEISTAGGDSRSYTWDPAEGVQTTMNMEGSPIRGIAYSPAGTYTAYITTQSLAIAQASPRRQLAYITGNPTGALYTTLAFSPDETLLAVGDAGGTVQIWSMQTGEMLMSLADGAEAGFAVLDVAFSPDGEWLAMAADDGLIYLWDVEFGERLYTLAYPGGSPDLQNRVNGVAFSPDGERIAAAYADGTLQLWDADTQEIIQGFSGHTGPVLDVVFSEDGTRLISGGGDGQVIIWQLEF